jgi:hypothetical protein
VYEQHPGYWYKMRKMSGSEQIIEKMERFYIDVLDPPAKGHMRQIKLAALNNFLTNLAIGTAFELPVVYYRNRNAYYSIPKRYGMSHYTYDMIIVNIANTLIDRGLVRFWKGEYQPWVQYVTLPEIQACECLWDFLGVEDDEDWGVYNLDWGERIQLKEAENKYGIKKLMKYDYTDDANRLRDALHQYNDFIASTKVKRTDRETEVQEPGTEPSKGETEVGPSDSPRIGPSTSCSIYSKRFLISAANPVTQDCRCHRVWNEGRWDRGGRFYNGDYQQLSEDKRAMLLINGNPVVELDYSGFHLRMLYHRDGSDFQGDPYQAIATDEASRNLLKDICIIGINADSRDQAFNAINEKPWKYGKDLKASPHSLETLFDRFEQVHAPISDKYYSGYGLTLQDVDSRIAADTLAHFTARGIPCLCVHDSFIVEQQHEDELRQVMTGVYKEHVNGFEPKIK